MILCQVGDSRPTRLTNIFAWSIFSESLKVSSSEERKDLKRGASEGSEEVIIPKEISIMDQMMREEVSIGEFAWVMESRRMIWIRVVKVPRTYIKAIRKFLRGVKTEYRRMGTGARSLAFC